MRLKFGIAIAGSHGKTTTTSMVAAMLSHADLDPTVMVGGARRHAWAARMRAWAAAITWWSKATKATVRS